MGTVIDHTLRYAPPEDVIRFAREKGWSTVKIVRTVSGSLSHHEALNVAREWAPLLGLSVTEFMKLRKKQISAKALSTVQSSLRYSRLGEACRSQFFRPFCEVHP